MAERRQKAVVGELARYTEGTVSGRGRGPRPTGWSYRFSCVPTRFKPTLRTLFRSKRRVVCSVSCTATAQTIAREYKPAPARVLPVPRTRFDRSVRPLARSRARQGFAPRNRSGSSRRSVREYRKNVCREFLSRLPLYVECMVKIVLFRYVKGEFIYILNIRGQGERFGENTMLRGEVV